MFETIPNMEELKKILELTDKENEQLEIEKQLDEMELERFFLE